MIIRASGCTCKLIYEPCHRNHYEGAVKIRHGPTGGILIKSNCTLAFEYTSQGYPNPAWGPPHHFDHIPSSRTAMRGGGEEKEHEDEVHRPNLDGSSNDDGEQDSEPTPSSRNSQFVFPTSESADSQPQCPYCRSRGSSLGNSMRSSAAPSSTGATSGYTPSDEFSAESCCSRCYLGPRHFEPRYFSPSRASLHEGPSHWSSGNCSRCGQPRAFCICRPPRHRLSSADTLAETSPVLYFALGLMCGIALAR